MSKIDSKRDPVENLPLPAAALIADRFGEAAGELMIGGVGVCKLVQQYGSPLYVYDASMIQAQLADLRHAYSVNIDIFYSMKANPSQEILKVLLRHGCGIEVASAGELRQALNAGCKAKRILFAGPGKSDHDLKCAVEEEIREIHIESVGEARRLNSIAENAGQIVSVALRVNPSESVQGGAMRMGGKPTPFGIDEEQLDLALAELKAMKHLHITGVHMFSGTQILDVDVLESQYRRAIEIAKRVATWLERPLKTIDFGGGLGVPYFPKDRPLNLTQLQAMWAELLCVIEQEPLLREAALIIEPGRFLVAESGVYVTRVLDVKQSRGKRFVVLDGGMHHHLAASGNLGQTIKRNFPIAVINKLDQEPQQTADLVGPLCTPLDTLGRAVNVPHIDEGDFIGVFLAGAYARTSSPHQFLSHPAPAEVLIENGESRLIRRSGTVSDLLHDQDDLSS